MPGIASRSPSSSHVRSFNSAGGFTALILQDQTNRSLTPGGRESAARHPTQGHRDGDVESHHHDSTKWQHRHSFPADMGQREQHDQCRGQAKLPSSLTALASRRWFAPAHRASSTPLAENHHAV